MVWCWDICKTMLSPAYSTLHFIDNDLPSRNVQTKMSKTILRMSKGLFFVFELNHFSKISRKCKDETRTKSFYSRLIDHEMLKT